MIVEIDTLWNVKIIRNEILMTFRKVEIDTLWNVKDFSSVLVD